MSSPDQFLTIPSPTSTPVRICYRTHGSPSNPAILLNAGGAQSLLFWHPSFISLLTTGSKTPHFVITYDYRDTGRSTHYPPLLDPSAPPHYTLDDFSRDAVALLDHLGVSKATWVGFSMGGVIAWHVAAKIAPERVGGLALISTSPVGPVPDEKDGLPGLNDDLKGQLAKAPMPSGEWGVRDEVVKFLVYFEACMAAGGELTEEQRKASERVAGEVFDRAGMDGGSVRSIFNHGGAAQRRWPREELGSIKGIPTTVMHGSEDGNVPLVHGETLSREIEGAKLVVLESMGHELPESAWEKVVEETLSVAEH